jgi:hypothetical protein
VEKKQKKNTRRRTVCRTSTVCPKVEWRAASVIRRIEGARKEEELKDPGNISAVIISATVRQLTPKPRRLGGLERFGLGRGRPGIFQKLEGARE